MTKLYPNRELDLEIIVWRTLNEYECQVREKEVVQGRDRRGCGQRSSLGHREMLQKTKDSATPALKA